MKIPAKFYKDSLVKKRTAYTVGEVKKLIAELPDEIPVEAGFSEGCQVSVYNHGRHDMHLEFEEIE